MTAAHALPAHMTRYKTTAHFTHDNVPQSLLARPSSCRTHRIMSSFSIPKARSSSSFTGLIRRCRTRTAGGGGRTKPRLAS